ncbi:MAG: hypothetical protein ACRCS9_04295 [Hyphomicrobium sp.]
MTRSSRAATGAVLTALALGAGLIGAIATPADAGSRGLRCKGGFQVVAGQLIATPYCQDELLATVARDHGMRASADKIRWNPNYKREVCRLVGRDIRVQEHCGQTGPSFRGRPF